MPRSGTTRRKRATDKFSIRDLLLVTVIVALAVGWWVDRARLAGDIRRLEDKRQAEQMAGEIEYERMLAWERKLDSLQPGSALPSSSAPALNPPKK